RRRRDRRRHVRDLQRPQQLAHAAHRFARNERFENAPPLLVIRLTRRRARRLLAQPDEPLVVVPLGPQTDRAAPVVDGQRNAAPLVDPAVRFVFRSFAVEDDAVEVEDYGFQPRHTIMITNRRPYSVLSASIGSTLVARRAGM